MGVAFLSCVLALPFHSVVNISNGDLIDYMGEELTAIWTEYLRGIFSVKGPFQKKVRGVQLVMQPLNTLGMSQTYCFAWRLNHTIQDPTNGPSAPIIWKRCPLHTAWSTRVGQITRISTVISVLVFTRFLFWGMQFGEALINTAKRLFPAGPPWYND